MSKQLVMENYVDECLDEVEIRRLYITEGIMDTPIIQLIKSIRGKIKIEDKKVIDLRHKILWNRVKNKEYHIKKIAEYKKKLANSNNQDYLNKAYRKKITHNELLLTKDKQRHLNYIANLNKSENSRRDLHTILTQAKSKPDLLGNVPYLYQIIGATVIIAAIGYGSYKLYKRFMSKAAKACKGKKGKVKTICMNQYQIKGLEVSKKPFTDGIRGCSKAKDVQACKAKFNKKINAINKKIQKKQNQIKKLASK